MIVLLMISIVFIPVFQEDAFAMVVDAELFDSTFIEGISQILQKENIESGNLIASKEVLYDIKLDELGYIYDFVINNEVGYAILIDKGFGVEMTELFLEADKPYHNSNKKNIYVNEMIYLEYNDADGFTYNEYQLSNDFISQMGEIAYYAGGSNFVSTEETIYYNYKNIDEYKTAQTHPSCKSIPNGLSNACVPIAAGNLIQYFDRFCENLLPNYTPGRLFGSKYVYAQQGAEVDNATLQLYYDMETNTTGQGATVDQFKSGLKKYCSRQGYSVEYNECVSRNQLDYSLCKDYLKTNIPIALFVTQYTIVMENIKTEEDNLQYLKYDSNHCMVAFGYKEVSYTMKNGSNNVKKYLQVATGLASYSRGYISATSNLNINNALAVRIY